MPVCSKIDNCPKIKMILDKDLLDIQYRQIIQETCMGCNEFEEVKPSCQKIDKPWGYEEILSKNDKYVIKKLVIKEGHRLSLQLHNIKRETWLIQAGMGTLILNDRVINIHFGDMVEIPPKTIHRVTARRYNLEILEVSTPELDDIVRIEDDYGRGILK